MVEWHRIASSRVFYAVTAASASHPHPVVKLRSDDAANYRHVVRVAHPAAFTCVVEDASASPSIAVDAAAHSVDASLCGGTTAMLLHFAPSCETPPPETAEGETAASPPSSFSVDVQLVSRTFPHTTAAPPDPELARSVADGGAGAAAYATARELLPTPVPDAAAATAFFPPADCAVHFVSGPAALGAEAGDAGASRTPFAEACATLHGGDPAAAAANPLLSLVVSTPAQHAAGEWCVRLCFEGRWGCYAVDDTLPVVAAAPGAEADALAFTGCVGADDGCVYPGPSLVEKALAAALDGGYAAVARLTLAEVFAHLCGAATERLAVPVESPTFVEEVLQPLLAGAGGGAGPLRTLVTATSPSAEERKELPDAAAAEERCAAWGLPEHARTFAVRAATVEGDGGGGGGSKRLLLVTPCAAASATAGGELAVTDAEFFGVFRSVAVARFFDAGGAGGDGGAEGRQEALEEAGGAGLPCRELWASSDAVVDGSADKGYAGTGLCLHAGAATDDEGGEAAAVVYDVAVTCRRDGCAAGCGVFVVGVEGAGVCAVKCSPHGDGGDGGGRAVLRHTQRSKPVVVVPFAPSCVHQDAAELSYTVRCLAGGGVGKVEEFAVTSEIVTECMRQVCLSGDDAGAGSSAPVACRSLTDDLTVRSFRAGRTLCLFYSSTAAAKRYTLTVNTAGGPWRDAGGRDVLEKAVEPHGSGVLAHLYDREGDGGCSGGGSSGEAAYEISVSVDECEAAAEPAHTPLSEVHRPELFKGLTDVFAAQPRDGAPLRYQLDRYCKRAELPVRVTQEVQQQQQQEKTKGERAADEAAPPSPAKAAEAIDAAATATERASEDPQETAPRHAKDAAGQGSPRRGEEGAAEAEEGAKGTDAAAAAASKAADEESKETRSSHPLPSATQETPLPPAQQGESATARALRELEDEADMMMHEPPPPEPLPLRGGGAATAPPGARARGSPGGCEGVFARLAATPQPQPAAVGAGAGAGQGARPPRKLTRLQQLQSVERMYKDSVDRKQKELARLETAVYGEPSVRHVLTTEEMVLFTDKLYSQGMFVGEEEEGE